MKAGWSQATLGEVCRIQSGAGFPLKHQGCPEGDFPFFKVGDMNTEGNEAYLVETPNYISEEVRRELGAKVLPPESIVFPKVGGAIATNKKRRIKVPSCVDNNVMSLVPETGKVSSNFLAWWMHGIDIYEFSNKANPPSITQGTVKDWPIAIPPLEEQQRIVAVLDEAFEGLARARAHTEANLQNARELFERQLGEYFSETPKNWISRKLKKITSKIGSGATPKGGAGAYKTKGISLIRSLNVHDRWLKEEKLAFIDDKQADKLSNVIVEERDVLLNITGASIARCCVAPSDFLPARVNQHVSIIRPDHAVLSPEFLALMLTSRPHKDGLLKTGEDNGSTRQALTKALIENLEVAFPPDVAQQESAVLALEAAELKSKELAEAYQAKIQDLDDLRQSLSQKAFAGELT